MAENFISYATYSVNPIWKLTGLKQEDSNFSADMVSFIPLTSEEYEELKKLKEAMGAKGTPLPTLVTEKQLPNQKLRGAAIASFRRDRFPSEIAMLTGVGQVSSSASDNKDASLDTYGGLDFTHESFDLKTYGDGMNISRDSSSDNFDGLTFAIITIDDLPSIFLE